MESKNGCFVTTAGALFRMTGSEIAEKLAALQKDSSEAEIRSWHNSIPVLAKVIHQAGLDEVTLILEYQTPIGNRIDAVLIGESLETGRPLVLIIELKQWSAIGENTGDKWSTVAVCVSPAEHLYEDRLHPVQQTMTYAKHLCRNHSNIEGGQMEVRCCQFLHNFENKEQLFQGNYQAYAAKRRETYTKGEDGKLAEDLRKRFAPTPRPDLARRFLEGEYVLGQVGFEDLGRVLEQEENAVMLDDQIEVNRAVCELIDHVREETFSPKLVVISGPPGTGKTVVGLHLLYAYCRKYGPGKENGGKCAFSLPKSRTLSQVITGASGVTPVYLDAVQPGRDMVVVDEAHRMDRFDSVMDKLLRGTRLTVLLQDDKQRIRLTEEGTLENCRRFAAERGVELVELSLASQKRAGYLGSYVSDVDRLLYEGQCQPIPRNSALEVRCWDSLLELDKHLHALQQKGRHVKWYAPFCWRWSREVRNSDVVIPLPEGAFRKAWNPSGGQYRWYTGELGQSLDQVGCIYTAQGLEYEDTGVIWWDDLRWDRTANEWCIDLNQCRDFQFVASIVEHYGCRLERGGPPWRVRCNGRVMEMRDFLRDGPADEKAVKELILNTYRVLLTRAKGSVHIWFHDPVTKEHVKEVMGI